VKPIVVFAVVVSICLLPAAVADSVHDLAWLAGCWASVGGEAGSGEQWMAPAGGTLLGMNRVVLEGKTVAYEFLQIRELEGGGIEFVARPSGQTGASFGMVKGSASKVVFENPDHDFPQRVIYRLAGDDQLVGRIEGETEDGLKAVDFPMKRVDCESGSAGD